MNFFVVRMPFRPCRARARHLSGRFFDPRRRFHALESRRGHPLGLRHVASFGNDNNPAPFLLSSCYDPAAIDNTTGGGDRAIDGMTTIWLAN